MTFDTLRFNKHLESGGFDKPVAECLTLAIQEVVDDDLTRIDDRLSGRFEAIDARFDAVDARFDVIDVRFDAMEVKFSAKIDKLQGELTATLVSLIAEMSADVIVPMKSDIRVMRWMLSGIGIVTLTLLSISSWIAIAANILLALPLPK